MSVVAPLPVPHEHPVELPDWVTILIGRLVAEFPMAGEHAIRWAVAHALHQFDSARIRAFVPILVEKDVRAGLRAAPGNRRG